MKTVVRIKGTPNHQYDGAIPMIAFDGTLAVCKFGGPVLEVIREFKWWDAVQIEREPGDPEPAIPSEHSPIT